MRNKYLCLGLFLLLVIITCVKAPSTPFQFDTMCTMFGALSHCFSQPICQDPLIADEINEQIEEGKSRALRGILMGDDLTPEDRARAEMGWDAGCAASP